MPEDKEFKELEPIFGEAIKGISNFTKLSLPADGKVHLTITKQTQELPSPLAPYGYKGVEHKLESVPAMADLLTRLGSAEQSIIYFNDQNINAILDRFVQDRPFDTAVYGFERSPQAADWFTIFGRKMGQRDFIKFLKSREPGEIHDDVEALIAMAQRIKGNFKIVAESEYIDSNNMGFVFKVEDNNGQTIDEGKMEVPSSIRVWMPLLKESPKNFFIDVELELTKPFDGNPPFFVLTCPRWGTFWREAVEKAVDELKDKLPDYLIMAGSGFSTNR